MRLIWHCDGNLMDMVPRLLEVGLHGFQGFQYEDGMDYERICRMKTREGEGLIIVGGASVTRTLPFGTPADVKRELELAGGERAQRRGCSSAPPVPLRRGCRGTTSRRSSRGCATIGSMDEDRLAVAANTRPRVVVIGCGFAGLWATRALSQLPVDLLVVDRNNYHTFIPLLYQVAAGELEPEEIGYPVRGIFRNRPNVKFVMEQVERVDFDNRVVITSTLGFVYDYLVLAIGSVSDFYGVRGAQEHASPLRTLDEAVEVRNQVLRQFERASEELDTDERARLLTFAIVGGGPTGVEFAGALAELLHGPLRRDFRQIDFREVRIILYQAMGRLMVEMAPAAGTYALDRLRQMGVDVRLNAHVSCIEPGAVALQDDTREPVGLVVWTAGVRADPLPATWGLPVNQWGQVKVEPTLQLPKRPEVYVIGDLAAVPTEGAAVPMLASAAIQEGEAAARSIGRQIRGRSPVPFRYRNKGVLATVGRNAAVAQFGSRVLHGFLAWVLWLTVHILYLIGFRRRISVLTSWAMDYLFQERAVRMIIPSRSLKREREE